MRKTKIICTLGPATDNEQIMRQLIESGMDVARFNFSHGDHAIHGQRFDMLEKLRKELDKPVAAMLDTRGPEVRTGKFENDRAELKRGGTFTLTTRDILGNNDIVSVNFPGLPGDLHPGARVLLDDGLIELTVDSIDGQDIHCTVVNGGSIRSTRGVNVPGISLSLPYLSEQDKNDILFGVEKGFDFIAASFVRCADDIRQIRRLLASKHCNTINIIAKIESTDGVENIDDILAVSDGIMIARGDMGVEIPFEEVPVIQKLLIKKTYNSEKQVITATQMLDSMMKHPRPTRAEATDVANAIYDGTSAFMLSGETAAGDYPIESVKTMAKIAERAERDINYGQRFKSRTTMDSINVTNAIAHATCTTAHDLNAAAIITVTKSGKTARLISKFRPAIPIVACSPEEGVCRQLNMSWGVIPLHIEEKTNTDELFSDAVALSQKTGLVHSGDLVVITAGVPLGISGTTNMMQVHMVGNILVSGTGSKSGSVTANLCVCRTVEEAEHLLQPGDILVVPETTKEMIPLLRMVSGIITESADENEKAIVAGAALGLPVLTGAVGATHVLKAGTTVTLDSDSGRVTPQ